MKFSVRAANAVLGVVQNSLFRVGYSAPFMRKAFDLTAGVSAEALNKKYPRIKLESGSVGSVPIETIDPGIPTHAHILFAHGGGYFMGSIHAYRRNALRMAYRCKAKVTLFEYRLAPEFPFPAALDDAKAVYQHLVAKVTEPLIVGGDSAGGGLALSLVLSLRDDNKPLPRAVFALSPWTDLTASQESLKTNHKKDVWLTHRHLSHFAPWYIGSHDPKSPYVSPFFGDYSNFPSLLVQVGDQEVLFDEAIAIVTKVKKSGGTATLFVGKDMQHVWYFSLPFLGESKTGMDALARFVGGATSAKIAE